MKRIYTDKQIDFLRKGYASMGIPDLTRAFNRKFGKNKKEGAIKSALKNRKITCGRTTGEIRKGTSSILNLKQITFIKKFYPVLSRKDLTDKFNRRFKTTITEQQVASFVKNHHINSGRTGCFEKGHIPVNKGVKGHHASPATEFKKGHISANTKTLGYERLDNRTNPDKINYMHVKVAEKNPYTGAPTRMKLKHVVVWEENHGPAPKGMAIILKDGDTTNCAIENLELVSRAELARLNQLKYRTAHPEIKPALLTLAKLKTKLFKAERNNAL